MKTEDLTASNQVVDKESNIVPVISVEFLEKETTVYNFEVLEHHNYFVSALGLLVHNNCIKGKWHQGTFDSPEDSLNYHYKEHKTEVNAVSKSDYINKADDFYQGALHAGVKKRSISGGYNGTPNVFRYEWNGQYVDVWLNPDPFDVVAGGDRYGIISFGKIKK